MFGLPKTTQLHRKLPRTAATEMQLLRPRRDLVSSTIVTAANERQKQNIPG